MLSNEQHSFRPERPTAYNLHVCDTQLATVIKNNHFAEMVMIQQGGSWNLSKKAAKISPENIIV